MIFFPSYYLTSGRTSRSKCDNCGHPFKEHRLAGVDRDGELHRCPREIATKKMPFLSAKDASAEHEAAVLFRAVTRDLRQFFRMGEFRCCKVLSNGAKVRVSIKMPVPDAKPKHKPKPRKRRVA